MFVRGVSPFCKDLSICAQCAEGSCGTNTWINACTRGSRGDGEELTPNAASVLRHPDVDAALYVLADKDPQGRSQLLSKEWVMLDQAASQRNQSCELHLRACTHLPSTPTIMRFPSSTNGTAPCSTLPFKSRARPVCTNTAATAHPLNRAARETTYAQTFRTTSASSNVTTPGGSSIRLMITSRMRCNFSTSEYRCFVVSVPPVPLSAIASVPLKRWVPCASSHAPSISLNTAESRPHCLFRWWEEWPEKRCAFGAASIKLMITFRATSPRYIPETNFSKACFEGLMDSRSSLLSNGVLGNAVRCAARMDE